MRETNIHNNGQIFPDIFALIENAKKNPPQPIVRGLLNEGEVAGLHGPPEAFKTIFTLQFAESIASGTPFLGRWDVPRPLSVYYFETEMSTTALGFRVGEMYKHKPPVGRIGFADEKRLKAFKRAPNLEAKFRLLREWVQEVAADVAILDTCNPFFRGNQSPSEETTVGEFFDHLDALPVASTVFVRHNHKPRMDDQNADGASRIRGSGQFADVPDLLMEIQRTDKRINKAELAVTKYRHGTKPDDLTLWFDKGEFRLCAMSPVIHLLRGGRLSREELLYGLETRFGVSQRYADNLTDNQVQLKYVDQSMQGHKRVYEINLANATTAAWYETVKATRIAR